jgi:hypothetical protein
MPLLHELIISLRELIDKLIVQVNNVIGHVMSDYRFLGLNQFMHDQRETHLLVEQILRLLDHERLFPLLFFLLGDDLQLGIERLGKGERRTISVLDLFLLGFIGLLWILGFSSHCTLLRRNLITFVPPLNNELIAVLLELGEQVCTFLVLDGDLAS